MSDAYIVRRGGGTVSLNGKSVLILTGPTGSTVTCSKGTKHKRAKEDNGTWVFSNLDPGDWIVTATLLDENTTFTVPITIFNVYRESFSYRNTPLLTYTGSWTLVDDDDRVIKDPETYEGDYKIRFLTSGVLMFQKLGRLAQGSDIFLVGSGESGGRGSSRSSSYPGAGGDGGSGGETKTLRNIPLRENVEYILTIGLAGKDTSIVGVQEETIVAKSSSKNNGGAGGYSTANGQPGKPGSPEFDERGKTLYGNGGGGGSTDNGSPAYGSGNAGRGASGDNNGSAASANSGSGGGGGGSGYNKHGNGGAGGSGIIIYRNHRKFVEVA